MQGRTLQITETVWHYVYNVLVAERACVESKYYLYDIVNMQATRRGTARDVSDNNCAVVVGDVVNRRGGRIPEVLTYRGLRAHGAVYVIWGLPTLFVALRADYR